MTEPTGQDGERSHTRRERLDMVGRPQNAGLLKTRKEAPATIQRSLERGQLELETEELSFGHALNPTARTAMDFGAALGQSA